VVLGKEGQNGRGSNAYAGLRRPLEDNRTWLFCFKGMIVALFFMPTLH